MVVGRCACVGRRDRADSRCALCSDTIGERPAQRRSRVLLRLFSVQTGLVQSQSRGGRVVGDAVHYSRQMSASGLRV